MRRFEMLREREQARQVPAGPRPPARPGVRDRPLSPPGTLARQQFACRASSPKVISTRPATGPGSQLPPRRGELPRMPGGAGPPVKPPTVALRRPWLQATPRHRGSGRLTWLLLWHHALKPALRDA
jgi:hypothetical protein